MYRTHATLLLAAASLAAAPLAAQTSISPGQTVRGSLEVDDQSAEGGPYYERPSYYDVYVIRGRPGDRVLVEMRSAEFDAHLRWGRENSEGWDWMEEAGNDDGGEGTDSRLVVILGEPGELVLRASGFTIDDRGEYELRVSAAPPLELPHIRMGETVRGELDDSDPRGENGVEDHFIVRGEPGSTFTAHLASDAFDPVLLFGILEEGEFLAEMGGADGGQDNVSRLAWEIGELPEYRLVVRAFAGEWRGAYTLRLEAGGVPGSHHDDIVYTTATTDTAVTLSSNPAGDAGADTLTTHDSAVVLPPGYEGMEVVTAAYWTDSDWTERTMGGAGSERGEDGGWYDEYALHARAGQSVLIEVVAEDFDPVASIGLGRGGRYQVLKEDDDSGPEQSARAKYVAPRDGLYVVRVRAAAPGQQGGYRLRVGR